MTAPEDRITLHTGEQLLLSSLYAEKPLALIFLRHLGCVFCRVVVDDLKNRPDLNIVFVALEGVEEIAEFKVEHGSPHTFICDTDKSLHEAFGMKQGGWGQIINRETFKAGLEVSKKGYTLNKPTSDPMMLSGVFIIGKGGEVFCEHRAKHAADNPTPELIAAELAKAAI